jgi:N-acylglucosamine-6-phosphate 2-epimerase
MSARARLGELHGGLVVSCQPIPGNPVDEAAPIGWMVKAAAMGGARGLRVNGPEDVAAVLATSALPVIAVHKIRSADSPVTITPTRASAAALLDAGARLIALDATSRPRPERESLRDVVSTIHAAGAVALGDLAVIEDLPSALDAGVDAVGTTLSGYTGAGPASDEPDFALLEGLVRSAGVPVFAEGRYWTREHVLRARELGASFVVVGTAITNPMAITGRMVQALDAVR